MNANPIFDLGGLKSHLGNGTMSSPGFRVKRVRSKTTYIRKLTDNTSAANFDGRRLVGRSGGITSMTGTTDRATADSVMTAWDTDHLKGRELPPALTDEKPVGLSLWAGGRIDIDVR